MNPLTPLIELASTGSLDLFFRVGQGYVACTAREGGNRQGGIGLSPHGAQSRAAAGIVSTLAHAPRDRQLHAWPAGPAPSLPVQRQVTR